MLLANGFKVIESYLIISGLLMFLNFLKFFKKEQKFGLKRFLQAIVYRYLRYYSTRKIYDWKMINFVALKTRPNTHIHYTRKHFDFDSPSRRSPMENDC